MLEAGTRSIDEILSVITSHGKSQFVREIKGRGSEETVNSKWNEEGGSGAGR